MPRIRAAVAALVLTALAVAAPATASTAAAARAATGWAPGPVVLVGVGGLRWDDISRQRPALTTLLTNGAVAALVPRSVELAACPVDGWLAVSSGRRADDARVADGSLPAPACRPPTVTAADAAGGSSGGGSATVERWTAIRDRARASSAGAVPGLLGEALARDGVPAAAVGPGAAVALARTDGSVAHYWPGLTPTSGGGIDPDADVQTLTDQLRAAFALQPRLLVVDLGAVRDDAGGTAASAAPPSREQQVAALDDPNGDNGRLGAVLSVLPENATLVVASLADSGTTANLQVAALAGPTVKPGLLRSGSTRQDGLVLATDVLPTVADALGLSLGGAGLGQVDGAPMQPVTTRADEAGRLERLLDLEDASLGVERLVTPFFAIALSLELLVLAGLAFAAVRLRHRLRTRQRLLDWAARLAAAGACLPVATFVANVWPWWRGTHQGVVLTGAVVTAMVPLALLATLGPWREHPLGPAAVVGGATAAILGADVATGSGLSLAALIGGQPLIGGRYFGFSNPGFALFGVGALLLALGTADLLLRRGRRREAIAAVAAIGLAATLVDVLPGLGADVGGPPALVPAFAYFALRVADVRVTWRRAAAIAAGTVLLVTVVCVADWLRPPASRTHLGRFVQTVLDGGGADVVQRKLAQNLGILVSGPLTLLIPVAAVAVVWALARPGRARLGGLETGYRRLPLLRPTVAAVGILLLLGFLANDSGTSIPPVAAMLLLPLLVAVCARAVVLDEQEALDAAVRQARVSPKRR